MSAIESALPTIADCLPDAAPPRRRPMSRGAARRVPDLRRRAAVEYVSSPRPCAAGVAIERAAVGASVNDLVVINPTPRDRAAVRGRGGPRRAAEPHVRRLGARCRPARSSGAGQLRRGGPLGRRAPRRGVRARRRRPPTRRCARTKNARPRARASRPGGRARRPGRGLDEVAAKSDRLGVASPTGAMHDVFESRRDHLASCAAAIDSSDRQIGALVAIGGALRRARPRQPPRRLRRAARARSCRATRSTRSRPAAARRPPRADAADAFLATLALGARDAARRDRPRPRRPLHAPARVGRRPRRRRRARAAQGLRRGGWGAAVEPVRRTRLRRPSRRR